MLWETVILSVVILDEQCQRMQEPEVPWSDPGGVPGVLRPPRLQQHQPPHHQRLHPRHHLHHPHWRDTLNQILNNLLL